jgi:hypothetical protein
MTDDLFAGSPHRFGDELTYGRVLHQALTSTANYQEVLTIIDTLRHEDLEHLALFVAAAAAATRSEERGGREAWNEWWVGIEGATPETLWPIVRPEDVDR